jgi:transcriptional regulator with XRE-family HTH domain
MSYNASIIFNDGYPDQNLERRQARRAHSPGRTGRPPAAVVAGGVVSEVLSRIVHGIGPKVRSLRKQAGLSLQQLAEQADVSAAAIHKIEQSGMVPTITTLLKVAGALGKPVAYFVEEEASEPTVHTPDGEQRPIYTSHTGIDLAGITGTYGQFNIAGARATVEPGASSGAKPLEHPGEELVYVLEGELEFTVAGKPFTLGPGDALHFRTVQPHSWRNPGSVPTVALWMALRPQ